VTGGVERYQTGRAGFIETPQTTGEILQVLGEARALNLLVQKRSFRTSKKNL
jgi:hypothetical protein